MKALVLVTVLGLLQHRVDLNREPWGRVMDAIREQGDAAAQAELERVAASTPGLQPWERSHAWRWAGQLALRSGRNTAAARDFESARRVDPTGFDAKMATVHLGELAMRERRWYQAERWLATVLHDSDPIVAAYATDRITAVRERTRRLTFRYAAYAWLSLTGLGLAAWLFRRVRRPGVAVSFARASLVAEGVAIGIAMLLPRASTYLARSGWMAFALPAAMVTAALWATRDRDARWWRAGLVVLALLGAYAAGLYVALDYTWWSVERPVL